jgi:hypothetical protein
LKRSQLKALVRSSMRRLINHWDRTASWTLIDSVRSNCLARRKVSLYTFLKGRSLKWDWIMSGEVFPSELRGPQ